MVRHYLVQAWRVLRKQRLHGAINVLGLSVGLAVTTLIVLFVQDEFSYDAWHENAERIFRIDGVRFNEDGTVNEQGPWQPYALGPALERDLPGLEHAVRFTEETIVLRVGDEMQEVDVLFADDNVFDVFTYSAVNGALDGALDDVASLVLTESAALRVFGAVDVVGQSVEARFDETYESAVVTAVLEDPPSNTNLPFEALLPFTRLPTVYPWVADGVDDWNWSSYPVFGLLREDANPAEVEVRLTDLWTSYYPGRADRGREQGWWKGEGDPSTFSMVPLRDLHLSSDIEGGFVPTSDRRYSLVLVAIGFMLLGLAAVNFTLLSVGQSATRVAEIGVRKALGAGRASIILQFGGEAMLTSIIGLAGGVVLAALLVPTARALTEKELVLDLVGNPEITLVLVLVALSTGLAASWYPIVAATRHRPIDALRGVFRLGGKSRVARALLVSQFSCSIILVAGALAMQAQLNFMQTRDVGFDASDVLVVHANGTNGHQLARHLKNFIGSNPDIQGISAISLSVNRGQQSYSWMVDGVQKNLYKYGVDENAFDVLNLDLIAGRSFDASRPADSAGAAVVTEALARDWGWTPAEAIGQVLPGFAADPEIIGVVRDVNFRSQHELVSPIAFTLGGGNLNYALIKTSAAGTAGAIEVLGEAWLNFAPEVPFEYSFLDEDVALSYRQDRRWSRLVRYSAAIAIIVACMGLFGMAALTLARRTKEIGVRKVLGASIRDVATLVVSDFAGLVVIATFIAGPLAYLGLQRWLEGFAYQIALSPWLFLGAGAIVLTLALATVSYHAIRAASSDPVNALRHE